MGNGNGQNTITTIIADPWAALRKAIAPIIAAVTTAVLVTVYLTGQINDAKAQADRARYETTAIRRELQDIKGELKYIRARLDKIWPTGEK